MSAIEKALHLLAETCEHATDVATARAELAALREENEKLRQLAVHSDKEGTAFYYRDEWEAQAKQIETLREALKECKRLVGIYDIVPLIEDALSSLPPSDMRLVPLEQLKALRYDGGRCAVCGRLGSEPDAPDCWLGKAIRDTEREKPEAWGSGAVIPA